MKQAIYEHLYDLENTNIAIHYYTNRGSYFPAHWHPAIELIYTSTVQRRFLWEA